MFHIFHIKLLYKSTEIKIKLDALHALLSIRILHGVHKKNLIQLTNKKYLWTLEVGRHW